MNQPSKIELIKEFICFEKSKLVLPNDDIHNLLICMDRVNDVIF